MITHLTSEKVLVNMNKNEIKQVLINLIKNGFEAIEDRTDRQREKSKLIRKFPAKIYLFILLIMDVGCPAKQRIICFLPFILLNQKGLAWDCPFVTKSLENIWVEFVVVTTKNTGTKFTIELPIYQK